MTFDEILTQVLKLLQRQGRVSYRALKRRFDLDDEYIEDVKAELIQAQRLAIDEDGAVLVRVGGPLSVLPASPTAMQEDIPDQRVAPLAFASVAPSGLEAERRQLTVMFCDLVDSTVLAGRLDPEELHEVVRAYQTTCAEVIQRFDGHIAQYLGDGLLVYFGYPRAHEDDAQRAIHTGLSLVEAMARLHIRLEHDQGIRLAVRLGIHTGLVVVGTMGGGGRHEQLALGETPNIAARIQECAEPNTVVISAATFHLVQGSFACQDLGPHTLKGVAAPVHLYGVLGQSDSQSRLDVAARRGLTPLVGREYEVGLLLGRWEQVKDGLGQVVLLSGEAGIGKSRLVQALQEHVATEPHTLLECYCSPYHQHSALYPVIDLLLRQWGLLREEAPDAKLTKLEGVLEHSGLPLSEMVPLFASLLSVPFTPRYPALSLSPERQKQRTLEALLAVLLAMAAQQPVLFIVEDLYWVDPSTLELLGRLIDQGPTARILTLLTCRPAFRPPWGLRTHLTSMALSRLPRAQVERIIARVAGDKALPPEVVQQLVAKTDGVPLFIEELTKIVLESGLLQEREDRYELAGPLLPLAIPATLHASLMARLDRLATAKEVAQLGAALGREFPYEILKAVSPLDDVMLQRALQQLVDAELLYQRGLPPHLTYFFKHALIRDAAYESLLKRRRQQFHQQIALTLEERFPETAATQPEVLAHHYTEAGMADQAVIYWQRAGERANERAANAEAIRHLTKGLEVLTALPQLPERLQHELALQTTLGRALNAARGYGDADVARVYTRARELCQHIGETSQLFPALLGLSIYYVARAELQTARELGEQLLSLAEHAQDPVLLVEAHYALGSTYFWLGEFASARTHLEQGVAHYDPRQHRDHLALYGQDGGAVCLCCVSLALWYLGYPDQALARSHEALALVREMSHPFSLAYVLHWVAWLYTHRREVQAAQEWADASTTFATEQGFPYWWGWGIILRGWTRAEQGREEEGLSQIHQGLVIMRATGTELGRAYSLSLMADVYRKVGQVREGLSVVDEALVVVDSSGERWVKAELYRLKGALLVQEGQGHNLEEVEESFRQALEVARRQQAKSLELRAAMSLSRLWQQQGKRDEARGLLAEVYGWFTEGFEAADLREARALLAELA